MHIELTSAHLKEKLQAFKNDTTSMCPYETGNLLLLLGDVLLNYVEYSNKQVKPESDAFLSSKDITKIDNLFRELGNNFFPMAHTTAPLRDLKIVNVMQHENLTNQAGSLIANFIDNCENNLEIIAQINERNIQLRRELLGELQNVRRDMREMLNP
jgi:hypothetical protein